MTGKTNHIGRRIVLQTVVGTAIAPIAGCLYTDAGSEKPDISARSEDDNGPFQQVTVEGTSLLIELSSDADVDQINLIQPNGEVFEQRDVAEGAQQVSFEIGTAYEPGKYHVIALHGGETIAKRSTEIQPDIQIRNVGLFRNNPDKPWDEVYNETTTDRRKNGEVFVFVENTGSGPDTIVELQFSGDVPNPVANPSGSGMYETEEVLITPGEKTDLFSSSFPFGTETENGVGCSPDGNSGQFTVMLETKVDGSQVSKTHDVQYSGSNDMTDCEVTIKEV